MSSRELQDRVCMVTGASTGIGKATAQALAARGATVVMVCRDRERGEAAHAEVRSTSGNPAVDLLLADLASQEAIHNLARSFCARYQHLHVLINNAGATFSRRTVTRDGVETTLATNYLAPFLLTHLLLPVLTTSAPSRIITVASGMLAPLDLADLGRERTYQQMDVYAQSKMAVVLWSKELARRLEGTGVTVNAMTPGMVRTDLGRDTHGLFHVFLTAVRPFLRTPQQAAEALLYLATSPEIAGISGTFFHTIHAQAVPKSGDDGSLASELWQCSEHLVGLKPV